MKSGKWLDLKLNVDIMKKESAKWVSSVSECTICKSQSAKKTCIGIPEQEKKTLRQETNCFSFLYKQRYISIHDGHKKKITSWSILKHLCAICKIKSQFARPEGHQKPFFNIIHCRREKQKDGLA